VKAVASRSYRVTTRSIAWPPALLLETLAGEQPKRRHERPADVGPLLQRMAGELTELPGPPAPASGPGLRRLHTGGVWVASSCAAVPAGTAPTGPLDIALLRDDFAQNGCSLG